MFLAGPEKANGQITSSLNPEQPQRISTWVSSSYRYVPLMRGFDQYQPDSLVAASAIPEIQGTFVDMLPQTGHCALGGCADANSIHACHGEQQCGCLTPGCAARPLSYNDSMSTTNPALSIYAFTSPNYSM